MTQTVTIHEAKTHLSRLIKAVLAGGEVVIARGKQPLVKLVPLDSTKPRREPGAWEGRVKMLSEDAFAPLTGEELALWEGGDDSL